MKNDLFEKAKQAVAVENGYSDWGQVLRICDYEDVYRMMEAVFEHGCNEAVKADRQQIAEDFDSNELEYKGNVVDHLSYINHCFPLPFPQQPDER